MLASYHPRATHRLRNILYSRSVDPHDGIYHHSGTFLRLTCACFSPTYCMCEIVFLLDLSFFSSLQLCSFTCCGSANNTKGSSGIGIVGTEEFFLFLSLHFVPNGRLKKIILGTLWKEGQGWRHRTFLSSSSAITLQAPFAVGSRSRLLPATHTPRWTTQGVLIRHFIRPGATSKFFPPFL